MQRSKLRRLTFRRSRREIESKSRKPTWCPNPTWRAQWAAAEGNQREPIGKRVVEVPDDLIRFESRDARSTFTAYVPVGSLAKGEALVTVGGSGKTIQCGVCHGPDLRGLGPLPSIAGRSPSYIFRQLWDFKYGARTGAWSPLMAQAVANLDEQDLVGIVAYLASREP